MATNRFRYGYDRTLTVRALAHQLAETPLLPDTIVAVLIAFDQTWCVPPLGDAVVEHLIEEDRNLVKTT
jgi:hypothetical protein